MLMTLSCKTRVILVKATLLEPQSLAMQAYIPRLQFLRRGRHDRATKSSSFEPSA